MKILIIGSFKGQDDTYSLDDFTTACHNIGIWLHSKHNIIVAGSMPPTADHYVLQTIMEEFNDSLQNRLNIQVYSANNDETQTKLKGFSLELHDFILNNHVIKRFNETRSYILVHLKAVKDANLTIVIGGGKDCADICALADKFGKRILAIPHYKGEGGERYIELKNDYVHRLTPDEIHLLSSDIKDKNKGESFLEIVDKIAKRSFIDYLQLPVNGFSLVFILLSIFFAWFYTYFYFSYSNGNILYISMLFYSVVVGIVGSLAKYTLFNVNEISRHDEANELCKAIAFGVSTGIAVALTTTSIVAFIINDSTIYSIHHEIITRAIFVTMGISFLAIFGLNTSLIKRSIDFIKKTIQ